MEVVWCSLMEALRVAGVVKWFDIKVTWHRGVGALGSVGSQVLLFSFMELAGMSITSLWLVMMMRTVTVVGRSCDSASRSHDTKASVVQDPEVSRHNFIFQHRAGRNVDSISMVGYDDDGSLSRTEIIRLCNILQKHPIAESTFFKCSLVLPLERPAFQKSHHQTPSSDPALACLECSQIVWDIPEPEGQKGNWIRIRY